MLLCLCMVIDQTTKIWNPTLYFESSGVQNPPALWNLDDESNIFTSSIAMEVPHILTNMCYLKQQI